MQYLRDQATNGTLPAEQYMDAPTLEWIKEEGSGMIEPFTPAGDYHLLLTLIKEELESLEPLNWDVYLPAKRQNSLHGILHAYRTAVFTALTAQLSGTQAIKPFLLAGLFHDIARENDQSDEGHGARSAHYLRDKDIIAAHNEAASADEILDAITGHDEDRPGSDMLHALKAGDALDRYRLPKTKWWPDESRIPTLVTNEQKWIAYRLVVLSESFALTGEAQKDSFYKALSQIIKEVSL